MESWSSYNASHLQSSHAVLGHVLKAKYFGMQIDCSLDWKEQLKAVSAKLSRALGFLKHTKSCAEGYVGNSVLGHCGASPSLLLLCLGLCRVNMNQSTAKTSESCC